MSFADVLKLLLSLGIPLNIAIMVLQYAGSVLKYMGGVKNVVSVDIKYVEVPMPQFELYLHYVDSNNKKKLSKITLTVEVRDYPRYSEET